MEVILKFFANEHPDSNHTVLSRTMGKIALVSAAYSKNSDLMPKPSEFWRCKVVHERDRGRRSGCFFVEPIHKVNPDDLLHLAPGMYTYDIQDGRMIVRPAEPYRHKACIMPLHAKYVYSEHQNTYCTIVDVSREFRQTVADSNVVSTASNPYPRMAR